MLAIILVPKPRRVGGLTAGPPCSIQRRWIKLEGLDVHSTTSLPEGTEKAPYLAALVLNSWIAADIANASFGFSRTPGPLMSNRSGPANGASVRLTMSSRRAPAQLFSVSRL